MVDVDTLLNSRRIRDKQKTPGHPRFGLVDHDTGEIRRDKF